MTKTIMKAKNIVIGEEIEVKIIDAKYNDDCVEVKIMEGKFKNLCAIVQKSDLTVDIIEVTKADQVVDLCEKMDVKYDVPAENEIVIEGNDYRIYVSVLEGICFHMSTLNKNIDWQKKCDEDIYFDMSQAYKNETIRSTIKAVETYIKKYI